MKKLLLLGIISWLAGLPVARAQVQDGTKYLGGTINVEGNTSSSRNNYGTTTSNNSQHVISPELQWGKFVNSTTMIGLGGRYSFAWQKYSYELTSAPNSEYQQKITNQSIGLLPFIRKYKPIGERWAVFLHAEVGPTYNWQKSKISSTTDNLDKGHSWEYKLSLKPGLVYFFPKRRLAIEGYANILSLNASYSDFEGSSGGQFLFSTGFSTMFPGYFTIRIAKYLPPKTN